MSAAALVTLVLTAALLAAVAALILLVIGALGRVLAHLRTIDSTIRTIADRTEPLAHLLADVNTDLTAVAERFDGVVGTSTEKRMTVGSS